MSGGAELTWPEGREILATIALFIPAIAASVEAGYLAGRLESVRLRGDTPRPRERLLADRRL